MEGTGVFVKKEDLEKMEGKHDENQRKTEDEKEVIGKFLEEETK